MPIYRKLVRDRIPEIIQASGRTCAVEILAPEAYRAALDTKLAEELAEYQTDGEVAELADLVEVVYAIVKERGLSIQEFEALRQAKAAGRGAFDQRLFLVEVKEPGEW